MAPCYLKSYLSLSQVFLGQDKHVDAIAMAGQGLGVARIAKAAATLSTEDLVRAFIPQALATALCCLLDPFPPQHQLLTHRVDCVCVCLRA